MKRVKRIFILTVLSLVILISSYSSVYGQSDPIRMIWQVHWFTTSEQMAIFKNSGVNVIHSFGTTSQTDANIQIYLDRAQANDLKVIMYLGYYIEGTKPDYIWNEAAAHAVMNKWKNHPALFAWHSMDEISNPNREYSKSYQQDVYNSIKENDSNHPVLITFNGTHQADWTGYFNETAFDLLDLHAYPNGRTGFWRPEAVLNLFKDNRTRNDYPVMGALRTYQADDWVDLEAGDIIAQADLLIENDINNIGFYGWYLQASNGYFGLNIHNDLYDELEEVILKMNAVLPVNNFEKGAFSIYPNPASDFLTINRKNENGAAMDIQIFDVTGKSIFKFIKLTVDNFKLNIQGVSKGIYFIKIKVDKKQLIKKMILN